MFTTPAHSRCSEKEAHAVALEADEVHCHGDGAVAVPVQGLDVVQQVSKELVAPFEHAQSHDVVAPHLLHDLSGQSLRPGVRGVRGEAGGGGGGQARDRQTDSERVSWRFCHRQLHQLPFPLLLVPAAGGAATSQH